MQNNYLYIVNILGLFLFGGCTSFLSLQKFDPLYNHVKYLASDDLKGRYPGTNGGYLAADYIRNEFRRTNLTLLGEDGFQYFDIVSKAEIGESNKLVFNNKNYLPGIDFIPLSSNKI